MWVIRPILVVYWLYYKTLARWKEIGVINILLKRIEGLILSILIMTDIYGYIFKAIGVIGVILMVYIGLVIITYKYEEINKFFDKNLIIININNVEKMRNNLTIIGTIINNLIQLLRDLLEEIEVHDYFHKYFPDKVNKLLKFEVGIPMKLEFFEIEIKNKISRCMYASLSEKLSSRVSNMEEWYLRMLQYKKEENIKIATNMYEEQKKD